MAKLTGLRIQNRNTDVVIAIIERMITHGQGFKDAAHFVAVEHGITYQAVTKFHCKEALRLWSNDEFIELVENGGIIEPLKRHNPKDADEIEKRLRPLYT